MSDTGAINPPVHAPMDQFPVADGQLVFAGEPLSSIANKAGRTPFYAYDRAVIDSRLHTLRKKLPEALHLHYAVKANPMPELVNHMARITDGLDVASAGELRLALDTGVEPSAISIAGPAKSNEDLLLAIESDIIINVESGYELDRITGLAQEIGKTPRVAIRVNPAFELKAAGMKMASGPKPFGIDAEQVPALLRTLSARAIEFMGFHIFCGSQNLQSEAITSAQSKTFELANRLAENAPSPVRVLNIGGGLGIPYFPGESRLDLNAVGENLYELMAKAMPGLAEAQVVMELGRFLTGEAGIYVCEVVERKVSRGATFLITNGGLHHHLAASGNFGQVIRKNYPLAVGNRMADDSLEEVNVVGPLCTPLDILGDKVMLPRAEPGDLIVVFQSGAYGYSASPRDFLGHPTPPELFL